MPEVQALGGFQSLPVTAAVSGLAGDASGNPAMFASLLQSLVATTEADGAAGGNGLPLAFLPTGKGAKAAGQLVAAAAQEKKAGAASPLVQAALALQGKGVEMAPGQAVEAPGKPVSALPAAPSGETAVMQAAQPETGGEGESPVATAMPTPAPMPPAAAQTAVDMAALATAQGMALPGMTPVAAAPLPATPAMTGERRTGKADALPVLRDSAATGGSQPATVAADRQKLPAEAAPAMAAADAPRDTLPASRDRLIGDALSGAAPFSEGMTKALQPAAEPGMPAQVPVQHAAQVASADRGLDALRGAAAPGGAKEALPMQVPFRAQGWNDELGQRLVWMAGRQTQVAELTVNPPNMGSIEVRLSLQGNEAGAQFFSAHPAVRDAIETALPRLREMLAESGFSLGDAQVSSESFAGRRDSGEADARRSAAFAGSGQGGSLEGGFGDEPVRKSLLGMVDLYA